MMTITIIIVIRKNHYHHNQTLVRNLIFELLTRMAEMTIKLAKVGVQKTFSFTSH